MRTRSSRLALAALLLLELTACRGGGAGGGRGPKNRAGGDGLGGKAGGNEPTDVSGYTYQKVTLPDAPAPTPGEDPERQPNVILIVLDTVRAMDLHLCGYDRPTTPFLDDFTTRPGVTHTCHAYSPGTWTIPSHTSYFTGVPVNEHGYDSVSHGFGTDLPVLSEAMADRGYQTVMVSANPTLSAASGLDRGFQHVTVAKTLRELRGDETPRAVRKLLKAEADLDKPLFLFVNVLDAHDPYPRVPDDAGWLPAQDPVDFPVFDVGQDSEYHRYVRGELNAADTKAYETRVRNGYDWGLAMADRTLSLILEVLRRDHWLDHGYRIVITSDHGEYLGEHGLLRHGCYTWEPVVRVPFVYVDSAHPEGVKLPEPFPSLQAYYLMMNGALRADVPTVSFSESREGDVKVGADMTALWTSNTQKLVAYPPGRYLFDLEKDPGELGREPLGEHPMREILEKFEAEHQANLKAERERVASPERVMELQALGYVQ